jgi:hypothetical protein
MVFSWQMAEELAAAHMRSIGYLDARRTPSGTDAGVDVVAGNAIAQVKYHAQAIGGPDIQRLRGAAFNHKDALFYSSSGYTPAAVTAAELSGVALFRYTTTNEVSPINARALELDLVFDLPAGITLENLKEAHVAIRAAGAASRANNALVAAFKEMMTEMVSGQLPVYGSVTEDCETLIAAGSPFSTRFRAATEAADYEAMSQISMDWIDALTAWRETIGANKADLDARTARILKIMNDKHEAEMATE